METTVSHEGREHIEAIARLGAGVAVVSVCGYALAKAAPGDFLSSALLFAGALLFVVGAICLLLDIRRQPTQSMRRNVLSITLDVVAISGGLYVGAGIVDPIALFYLWMIVGSGIVYGTRYLYLATALAAAGFGMVYLASPHWQSQPMFSATVAGLMLLLAPYLATLLINLEKAQALVMWQADHDGLTELLNRRAFERRLDDLVPVKDGDPEHFLLYLDLDRFKEINDSAGHAAGDRALQDIAAILRNEAGQTHLAARMGGDEFCLLLLNETQENARRCAERIRSEVASYRLAWGTAYYTLGTSVGMVGSNKSTDGGALVRLADAACYAAKNNGRNQVHAVDRHSQEADTQVIRRLKLPESSHPSTSAPLGRSGGSSSAG